MDYQNIVFEKKGKIATIMLNRPEKLNALSGALLAEFDQAIAEVDDDAETSVLVIKGAGRAFCSGYDLTPAPNAQTRGVIEIRQAERKNIDRWMKLWNLSKITIAQVHGYCLAGGTELAAMCDMVIAAEDAQFGYPIVRGTGTPPALMWPWLMGVRRTKMLLYTGDSVNGVEAADLGLANKAVPHDKLAEEVEVLAGRIAKVPLDLLLLSKSSTNGAAEAMGLRSAINFGFANHIVGHATETVLAFDKNRQEMGLRGALEERDSPFRT